MLYFAYGSMMEFGEMARRCPSAKFVARARLPDHSLRFTRRSANRGCGVADAVPCIGQHVWGVVYDILESDLAALDRAEGFRPGRPLNQNSYVRQQMPVLGGGNVDQPMLVWVYFANPQKNPPLPDAAYKRLLLDGARRWQLPEQYQAELEKIHIQDTDSTA